MARVKSERQNTEREKGIRDAKRDYLNGIEPSIRSAASTYGIPYTTLQNRLRGRQPHQEAHQKQQLLTVEQERSIVRFCVALDDLGHPLKLPLVKQFASSLLTPSQRRNVGKHWLSRFLCRNPSLVTKFSQRLDRQRATASNPAILKDFYQKVQLHKCTSNFASLAVSDG